MAGEQLSIDERFMRRALALAARGRGGVEPNPMVGCVIVREGRAIGEGFHERFGGPHAEAAALAACTEPPAGATAYVTIEPCCHTNKKTPPCVPRLIDARIARVVIGCADPNPQVAGRGIGQLRAAGMGVAGFVLEAECKQLNAPFFALVREGRPYVTLKWAQSADGAVAGPPGTRLWISNSISQRTVHRLRSLCDAILVGINTVRCDDPLLTVRGIEPMRTLTRVVLDAGLSTPVASRLVRSAQQGPILVYCSTDALQNQLDAAAALRRLGVEVVAVPPDAPRGVSLTAVLKDLGSRSFTHLLVEPGPTLARGFLEQGLADRVWIYRSPANAAEKGGLAAPAVDYPPTGEIDLGGDRLTEYLNPAGPCFFSLQPAPDFELVRSPGASSDSPQE